jgi:hypothetical protein
VIALYKVKSVISTLSNTRFLQITKFDQYIVSPELLALLTVSEVGAITLCQVISVKTTLSNTHFRHTLSSMNTQLKLKSKSKLCYDRRSAGQIFITARQLRVCWCGAISLTREGVCRLQLLLVLLASALILGSESRGTRDHILLSSCQFKSKSKSKLCYDRRSAVQSLLVSRTHLGLTTRLLLLPDSCGFFGVGRSLSGERKGLPFTIYAGPHQRSHSWVRVPRGS